MNFIPHFLIACAILLGFSNSHAAEAQFPPFDSKHPQGFAGGYSPAKIDKSVQKAAAFAVTSLAKTESLPLKLVSIAKAETQVVAGTNYHFLLVVNESGKSRFAEVIVYRSLDSKYQMTAWRWLSK